jgi:large subunit ribosomal protein L29
MKIKEIRDMTDDELRAKARDFQQDTFNLRRQQQAGQIEKPSRLKDLRRSIARIETVLRERALGIEQKRKGATPAAAGAK